MNNHKETPEESRERLRQKELKNNPAGSLHDAVNRGSSGSSGNLTDLAGELGWKGMGIVIVVLIVGYVLYKLFQ